MAYLAAAWLDAAGNEMIGDPRTALARGTRLVEVVGPAGAGKTTLCRRLAGANGSVRLGAFPDVRSVRDAPFFIWYALRTMPGVIRQPDCAGRRLTRREFAWLSILNGWPMLLQKERRPAPDIVVLDQGPVYLLTEMFELGPQALRGQGVRGWWHDLYGRWAPLLDTIVWLDAPDPILSQRIDRREKDHIAKNRPSETVYAFLNRFRAAYAHTISLLAAHNSDFRLLLFDTERQSPDEIAGDLLAAFGLGVQTQLAKPN